MKIMNKIKLLIVCIATVLSGNAMAQKVSAQDVTIASQGTADLVISLESPVVAAAAQLNVVLPEGIEVDYDADEEEYKYTKGDIVAKKKYISISKETDGSYSILIHSGTDAVSFSSESGSLVTLPLVAGEIADATLEGAIKNIKVSDFEGNKLINGAEATFNVTVGGTTGISAITAKQLKNGEVYNLKGQKVDNVNKGLYIVGGKKVVLGK
jgi:hypothetical protein